MRLLACLAALAAAAPARSQEVLPPPPPPPSTDPAPPPALPPAGDPSRGGARPGERAPAAPARRPGTIGEAPVAPAGSQAAPLHPDEAVSHWRFSLATGISGKFGGMQLSDERENPGVLLYFGAQADGLWTEGYGQAARFRVRLFTGGENEIYIPSDGDAEAAYMIGRREFRFVIGRLEVGRYPALGVETLAQLATLPCFEGSLSLAGDTQRLYYYLSPIEAAWVYYYGDAHIEHSAAVASESDRPVAASAGRLRYTVLLPPSVLLSLQGDLMKMWQKPDLLVSGEGSLGYQVLDQSAVFNVAVRWNNYTRRAHGEGVSKSESEVLLLGIASLVF
jgi:hypothetical protein